MMEEMIYQDYYRQMQYIQQQADKRFNEQDIELLLAEAFKPEPEEIDLPF